jgi:hypothetical protein
MMNTEEKPNLRLRGIYRMELVAEAEIVPAAKPSELFRAAQSYQQTMNGEW